MFKLIVCFAFLLWGSTLQALEIFTCEPEWGSLAQEIGKDKVSVSVASRATEDVHFIQARPSLIASVRRADLVVCTGAGLEAGWLPVLLRRGGNAKIQVPPGLFYATNQVILLNPPLQLDRSQGDLHPGGNPHVHLDPNNIVTIGLRLMERMSVLDPENAEFFQSNYMEFESRLQEAMSSWQEDLDKLQNVDVIVHHDQWVYLNRWLGLNQLATLEPLPGVPPTVRHMSSLKSLPAKLVIRANFKSARGSTWLTRNSSVCEAVLPYTVGGNESSTDLINLYRSIVELLLTQLECGPS